jgi:hypothetical protein
MIAADILNKIRVLFPMNHPLFERVNHVLRLLSALGNIQSCFGAHFLEEEEIEALDEKIKLFKNIRKEVLFYGYASPFLVRRKRSLHTENALVGRTYCTIFKRKEVLCISQ